MVMRKQALIFVAAFGCCVSAFAQKDMARIERQERSVVAAADTTNDVVVIPDIEANEINISCRKVPMQNLSYAIMTATGDLLMDGDLADCSRPISITALPYGEYMLRLSASNQVLATQKIVKQ